ncbi:hypothetical protein AB0L54_34175, partial [Streptomyces sp. NPDC052196]|uniref:hypothetical protein n=1 Tax=Streptomyces sp. NPDC052196 TaxID=3156691 RepID=UPI00341ABF24
MRPKQEEQAMAMNGSMAKVGEFLLRRRLYEAAIACALDCEPRRTPEPDGGRAVRRARRGPPHRSGT